ncbi:MAG: hypothetical protein RLN88_10865 [Ekhidna sp.]|uniref:hypothetical protein n=1 Tax=Ekhidna sp. TaxID=2608089 RepID=UPI0032F0885A
MRLGQFARKYNIPVQEIIDYLHEEVGENFHPNVKLYDAIESKVLNHFEILPSDPIKEEAANEEIKEKPEELPTPELRAETPEDDIASVEGELSSPKDNLEAEDLVVPQQEALNPRHSDEEIIETDKLLEMLESDEGSSELEKIKLIRASKRELSGLKVLGKVELPEPKKKTEPEDKQKLQSHKNLRSQLSEEEKERRRLKAKRKKEAFEARREKLRKEQEAQRLKELKAQHYKQKLQNTETINKKREIHNAPEEQNQQTSNGHTPEPKTWLGKWWRWMNT